MSKAKSLNASAWGIAVGAVSYFHPPQMQAVFPGEVWLREHFAGMQQGFEHFVAVVIRSVVLKPLVRHLSFGLTILNRLRGCGLV